MKGILFKPEIWQAKLRVLEEYGEAVTRRVIKPQLVSHGDGWWSHQVGKVTTSFQEGEQTPEMIALAPYQVGETVYIKEKIWRIGEYAIYYSDSKPVMFVQSANRLKWRWQRQYLSPIHLPYEAARYFVLIEDVRAERLQMITEEDAIAEGICPLIGQSWRKPNSEVTYATAIEEYARLWNSLNKDYPWESNPFVFRYEFELVK